VFEILPTGANNEVHILHMDSQNYIFLTSDKMGGDHVVEAKKEHDERGAFEVRGVDGNAVEL